MMFSQQNKEIYQQGYGNSSNVTQSIHTFTLTSYWDKGFTDISAIHLYYSKEVLNHLYMLFKIPAPILSVMKTVLNCHNITSRYVVAHLQIFRMT